jgi:SpoVK/Ycf46/Vps4 family AAA+-type ATPase
MNENSSVLKENGERISFRDIKQNKLSPTLIQEPRFNLEKDVILSKESSIQLNEALTKIKYHKKMYSEWGFDKVDPCGKGIMLNFYGKSGTGKTIAAEAFAGTLQKSFLPVGISDIESKFMGETAKNISQIFEIAGNNNSILFFDEADTLLGKRLSSVTQGVDHEVNSFRSTLLIELEKFEGIVIFATNFAENYDKAFENRITHHIYFPLPDSEMREKLWEKHLVNQIPLKEERTELIKKAVDHSIGLSGRDIRTILRLAIPKALIESEPDVISAKVSWEHISQAIDEIRIAHKDVGQEVNPLTSSARDQIKKSLGLQ